MKKLVFFCVCCLILSSLLTGIKFIPFVNGRSYPWTDASLRSVFVLNSSNVWAVGQNGAILRWNGLAWKTVASPTTSWLQSVCMNNETDGWAVGSGADAIIRWNGTFWETVPSPISENLYEMSMVNPNDGWAVGWDGKTIHWNGTGWSTVSSPTTRPLYSVYMADSSNVWAVGDSGTIIHWNGTAWNTVSCPTTSTLFDVFMVTTNDGWGVGTGGTIIHYNGTAWGNVSSPTTNGLRSVFMLNSTEGWAVGDSGTIIRWNGTAWNSVPSSATGRFFSVFMIDENDGWAVGDFGSIIHWNGVEWVQSVTSIYQGDLIISGDDVFTIEDETFDINGSIIVEENATLILRNAILNFTQMESNQFNMTFRNPVDGNPRLEAENATLVTNYWFGGIRFYGNTSAKISDSDFSNSSIDTYDSCSASLSRSTFNNVDNHHSANVSVSNSTIISYLRNSHNSILLVSNCSINTLLVNGNKTEVSESSVDNLKLWASGINCTIDNLKPGYFSYWNFLLNCSVEGLDRNLTLINTQINEWGYFDFHASNVVFINSVITDLDVYDGSTLSIHGSEIDQLRCLGSIASIHSSKVEKLLGYLRMSIYPDPEVRIYGNSSVTVNLFYEGENGEGGYSSSTFKILSCHDSSSIEILGYVTMLGNIAVWDDSELRLRDAVINFTQTHDEQSNMTFSGQSKLQATNATITSNYAFIVYFYENSSATVSHLEMPVTLARFYAFDSSVLDLNEFTSRYLRAFNSSNIRLSNSAPYYLRSYNVSVFNITNCSIRKQYSFNTSEVTVSQTEYIVDFRTYDLSILNATDSTIDTLYAYDESTVWLLNSTYNSCVVYEQSEVYVSWYLDAHVVDSIDQDVPSANVTAHYPNATMAESKLTDSNGWASLTLLEKMTNATGDYPVGNYTVEATYLTYSSSTTVNMTGNQVITLRLEDFIIPEFQCMLILPLFIISTLLAALVHRKKNTR